MQVLSSGLTTTVKILPPIVSVAYAAALVTLASAGRLAGPGLIVLVLPLLVLPWICLWASRLKHVSTNGRILYATDRRNKLALTLTAVRDVSERRGRDVRTVTVTCNQDTPWGQRISFLAPLRCNVARGIPHPSATTLQLLALGARQ
jgi:hypothetical protein